MKHKRPKEGWPWDRPGHQFYTDAMRKWLGGYEPILAAEMCRNGRGHNASAAASAARDKGLKFGEVWATGTLYGLGPETDTGKLMRMLKASKLG